MNLRTEEFSALARDLNDNQKQAVEKIYGPVLVIAGPGTGKTQVLALRIANILLKTDTKPQNILALTFTENGAVAMRKRLLSIIGPDAHSVRISTFHSFCQDVISEFSEKFIFARRLEVIEDITKIQLLEKLITELDLAHLRPYKNPHFFLKEILLVISALKKEGIPPGEFREHIDSEKRALEEIPETEKINPKTGKMKQKYVDRDSRIGKNYDLHLIYEGYQKELEAQGWYDFEDMIMFVLNKMKTDEDLLWTLRERFLFLLVDEFQDTNGAQMELVELFAGDEEDPNIFAVGDDDQSIFRFQGASLENILSFREKFPRSEIVVLTENYRSTQKILDLASSVIGQNEERLIKKIPDLDKNLRAASGESGSYPEVHIFPQEEQEHFFLAQKIRNLHDENAIPFSEIALLVRNNSEGFELLNFLERQGIPAHFSGRGNALKNPVVLQMLHLLRLAIDPEDDALFFECLHYSFLHIPIERIWTLWESVKSGTERTTGRFWKFWREKKNAGEIPPEIRSICERLERWQYDSKNITLLEFFQKVSTESGLLESLVPLQRLPIARDVEKLNALNALFAELKNFSKTNRNSNLDGFLRRLEIRETYGLSLPESDIFSTSETVQILTTHKAKGLEFEAVFLVHVISGRWGDQRNFAKITLPDNIFQFSSEHDPNEEERRLFYVACTRAKRFLFLSRSEVDSDLRERSESRFLSEIPPEAITLIKADEFREQDAFELFRAQITFHPDSSALPTDFLKRAVAAENFALSHSAFENFRENPQKFLWENVLGIPQLPHPSAMLGTAIHRALEEFVRFLPEERLEEAEKILLDCLGKEIVTERELQDLKREGTECLRNYLKFYTGKFARAEQTEFNFRSHGVFLDGEIPMTGKIDKIEWISQAEKTVRIIDYKVTAPRSENEIRGIRESDANDITAGRYFRQLVFYSLLCDLSPRFPYRAEEFEIDFLVPNASGVCKKLTFIITGQEKEALKEEIRLVWKKIQNLDFRPINLWGQEIPENLLWFLENAETEH